MKPGTVFKWNQFPYPKYGGKIKARWFICLGDTGILSNRILVHLCTTTTHSEAFKPGRDRANHRCFVIEKSKYPFFDEDCILDYDEDPYAMEEDSIQNNTDIEIRGQLDRNALKTIYHGLMRSNFYPKRIILDIHTSLNRIGITGLTKP